MGSVLVTKEFIKNVNRCIVGNALWVTGSACIRITFEERRVESGNVAGVPNVERKKEYILYGNHDF